MNCYPCVRNGLWIDGVPRHSELEPDLRGSPRQTGFWWRFSQSYHVRAVLVERRGTGGSPSAMNSFRNELILWEISLDSLLKARARRAVMTHGTPLAQTTMTGEHLNIRNEACEPIAAPIAAWRTS